MSARLLVVDDERAVRTALEVNLSKRGDEVTLAEDADEALRLLRARPFDLVLTDVKMPGASGLDLLRRVRQSWPETPVVVMTGQGSVEDAVAAMKAGAADYLVKPVARDELFVVLDKALEQRTLRAELVQLRREVTERYGLERIVGVSPAMVRVYEQVAAVADSQATVLLQGQTGTGKELLAHALHYRSRRATAPFVRVNCTAIPESLLESELFGHEQGAFTGAVRQHRGKFEQADGGTLFLDEIGEIDAAMQASLLRVLEVGEFQRVGGTGTLTVDVRVVAATNRDLRAEVAAGRFREDLFYRLAVVTITVPPLARRLDDLPLLVDHFVQEIATREGRVVPPPSPDTLARLREHAWPGNVRQLRHAVERAVLLHREGEELHITAVEEAEAVADAGPAPTPVPTPVDGRPLGEVLEQVERAAIIQALRAAGGVQAQAARDLGLSKSNLHYRIRKLGIELADLDYR
ncbi:MAG: sigma-54-dependent Fis family transcriptional regulator [Alphaproteobacteria bacterium]|nr:sigma-54-dependent Fis family transcriptional regulator [Alphaproteobacteria bacterium]